MNLGSQSDPLKDVSVLFSDIRGYSTLSENQTDIEVAKSEREYMDSMVEAVFKYKQTVQKHIESACIGNKIIAIFGSPLPLENHAWMAVQTAVEMCQQLVNVNATRSAAHQSEIRIGIGINSSSVPSGQIGASSRMEFTAMGDGVNLGYYLQRVSKQYGTAIVVGESTYRSCGDRMWVRELDSIHIPGENRPVALYEFLGLRSDCLSEQKEQVLHHYDKGRELYLKRKFALAMGEFAKVMQIDNTDKAAGIQLERCQHLLQFPPPDDWDGVWAIAQQ